MADPVKPAGKEPPDPAAAAAAAAPAAPTSIAGTATEPDAAATAAAAAAVAAGKPAEPDPQKPGAKKAPEKYELQLPEGGRLDQNDLTQIETLARENDWTKDEAQGHLDAIADSVAEQAERWLTDTKADKTYGGDNLATTQKLAMQAVARLRPDGHPRRASFLAFMNRGGAGNHLEVVSFLADLGKLMAEDSPALTTGGGGGGGPNDAATVLYGQESKT